MLEVRGVIGVLFDSPTNLGQPPLVQPLTPWKVHRAERNFGWCFAPVISA